MNWKETKKLLSDWIEQVALDRHRHELKIVTAYREVLKNLNTADFEGLLHNRIDCLLFNEAVNQKLLPKPLED